MSLSNSFHQPVLVTEVTALLQPEVGKRYIDATIGAGGHSQELLRCGASVLGIDQDPAAIDYVKRRDDLNHKRLILAGDNFSQIDEVAKRYDFKDLDGVLFDLGVSSFQLETAERGFSLYREGPLDMRMSSTLTVTAKDLVNGLGKKELTYLFRKYSQEPKATQIAQEIVDKRRKEPITTTQQLASLVERVYRIRRGRLHPATKVFQALRMAVNDEMNSLRETLPKAWSLLKRGGRMVVISFHEGEARVVKQTFQDWIGEEKGKLVTPKPLSPSEEEKRFNIRARSAQLRCIEKII